MWKTKDVCLCQCEEDAWTGPCGVNEHVSATARAHARLSLTSLSVLLPHATPRPASNLRSVLRTPVAQAGPQRGNATRRT